MLHVFLEDQFLHDNSEFHSICQWGKLDPHHNARSFHCVKSVQIRSFFWSVFSCIWTEYGSLEYEHRISQYSVQMGENTGQKKLRIWTLFTQCFFIYQPFLSKNIFQYFMLYHIWDQACTSFFSIFRLTRLTQRKWVLLFVCDIIPLCNSSHLFV